MPCGVLASFCIGTRITGATLVKKNDAVMLWGEELRVGFGNVTAGAAVEVDGWTMLMYVEDGLE